MAKRPRKRVSKKARTDAHTTDASCIQVGFQSDGAAAPASIESCPAAPPSAAEPAEPATATAEATAEPAAEDGASSKKRKRTRKRKRSHIPYAGPDVDSMDTLGESAKRAIAYAQLFLTDKHAWKFSKQKQNWLLRHMLWSPALVQAGQAVQDIASDLEEAVRSVTPPAVSLPESGAWVDDEHVPVVAHYLQSMMGLAKQRMMETLASAASPPSVASPPEPTAQEGDSAPDPPAPDTAPAADAGSKLTQWFSLRAERASKLLEWIHACQDTPSAT